MRWHVWVYVHVSEGVALPRLGLPKLCIATGSFHEKNGNNENNKDNSDNNRHKGVECWNGGNHRNHRYDPNHGNPGCKTPVPQRTGFEISDDRHGLVHSMRGMYVRMLCLSGYKESKAFVLRFPDASPLLSSACVRVFSFLLGLSVLYSCALSVHACLSIYVFCLWYCHYCVRFDSIGKLEKAVAVRNFLLEGFSGTFQRCWNMIPRFSGSAKCYPCQGLGTFRQLLEDWPRLRERCWIFSPETATTFLSSSDSMNVLGMASCTVRAARSTNMKKMTVQMIESCGRSKRTWPSSVQALTPSHAAYDSAIC